MHFTLLQICCARRLRHIDLQDARFWLLRFVTCSSILLCVSNGLLRGHRWSRRLSIYVSESLRTILGSATPEFFLVYSAATKCRESKLIWHNPLFPGMTAPSLFCTIHVISPSVCKYRALWNCSLSYDRWYVLRNKVRPPNPFTGPWLKFLLEQFYVVAQLPLCQA